MTDRKHARRWRRAALACAMAALASPSAASSPQLEAAVKAKDYVAAAKAADDEIRAGDMDGVYVLTVLFQTGKDVQAYLPDGLALLRRKAAENDIVATVRLGEWLQYAIGGPRDYAGALVLFKRAAERGNPTALNDVGAFYSNGYGVPQDDAEAYRWYVKASQQGDHMGQLNTALALRGGYGVKQDIPQARQLAEQAVNGPIADAHALLGIMMWMGEAGPVDKTGAVRQWADGAKQGSARAQYNLAVVVAKGTVPQLKLETARALYEASAKQDFPQAEENLALQYEFGPGPIDYAQGLLQARRAVSHKLPHAYGILANFLVNGHGVKQDVDGATTLYKACADAGDAMCALSMASIYQGRFGVTRNDQATVAWLQRAADLGSEGALVNLAGFYREGRGVPRDDAKAEALVRKSMTTAFAGEAVLNLGMAYEGAARGASDEARAGDLNRQAADLYKQAAQRGIAEAQERLGVLMLYGRGMFHDEPGGVALIRAAAEGGVASAQTSYGVILLAGLGADKDVDGGLSWLKKAADQGDAQAKQDLEAASRARQSYIERRMALTRFAGRSLAWRYDNRPPVFAVDIVTTMR